MKEQIAEHAEAAHAEPEPARNYVTVQSLKEKKNFIVKLKFKTCNKKVDKLTGRVILNKHTFTSDIINITGIEIYPNYAYVTGRTLDSLGTFGVMLPKYFKMHVLDGDEEKEYRKKFNMLTYASGNLRYILSYGGTIGADPEIFVVNKNDELIPAPMFLGAKEKPNLTAGSEMNHGANTCYWDGFQAEFTTWSGSCLGWLIDSIHYGLLGVLQHARKKVPDAKLSLETVMMIPPDLLQSAPIEVVNFGCMPSFNAYGLTIEIPPGNQVPFRSIGGHIHFGHGNCNNHKAAVPIVKALDAIIGVACVALFNEVDSPLRRKFYGLPGEYRIPKHGIEYRPLSAAWMSHPFIANLVIDVARKAFKVGHGNHLENLWEATEEETVQCMLNSDVVKAKEILERNKATFTKLISLCYGEIGADKLFNVFYNGMQSVLKNPYDIETNWALTDGSWVLHGEKNVRNNLRLVINGEKI